MDNSPWSEGFTVVRQILAAGKGFHLGAKPERETASFFMRSRDASFFGPLPYGGLGTVEDGSNFIGTKARGLDFFCLHYRLL